jgi:heme-degrading monooxygenase HmoA
VPKARVIITQWDSIEQLQALRNSASFKDARKIGDQYEKFNSFVVEGVS